MHLPTSCCQKERDKEKDEVADTLLSIQLIPRSPEGQDPIVYIEPAIEMIQQSGLVHRVSPLETTVEGQQSQLLHLIGKITQEMTHMHCPSTLLVMKLFHKPDGISMKELVQKYED